MWVHMGYRKDGRAVLRYVQGFKGLQAIAREVTAGNVV